MITLHTTMTTQDGRKLQLIQAGQMDGVPVLVHHGTPGSRGLYPAWIADAEARGIQLIGYDRRVMETQPPRQAARWPRPQPMSLRSRGS